MIPLTGDGSAHETKRADELTTEEVYNERPGNKQGACKHVHIQQTIRNILRDFNPHQNQIDIFSKLLMPLTS